MGTALRGVHREGEEPKAHGSSQEGGCKENRSSGQAAPLQFTSARRAKAGPPHAAGISAWLRDDVSLQSSWEGTALSVLGAGVCQDGGFWCMLGKDP